MKHLHCHCGLKSQIAKLRARKLGKLGLALFGLHLLFHVAECLIVPAILVGVGGHLHEDTAIASESALLSVGVSTCHQIKQLQLHSK